MMLVTGLDRAGDVVRKHPDVRAPLERWNDIVELAEWHSIAEVRQVLPTADAIKGTGLTCFNLGGNKYRLITIVSYALQTVAIVELLTHAEYDRKHV